MLRLNLRNKFFKKMQSPELLLISKIPVLTSLDMKGTNVPLQFHNSSKKLFYIDSERLRFTD